MEVLPNIHQFRIPIPDNPLGFINAYLITTRDGCLLIDLGWNASQAFDSLQQQMADVGVTLADLRYIAITHVTRITMVLWDGLRNTPMPG